MSPRSGREGGGAEEGDSSEQTLKLIAEANEAPAIGRIASVQRDDGHARADRRWFHPGFEAKIINRCRKHRAAQGLIGPVEIHRQPTASRERRSGRHRAGINRRVGTRRQMQCADRVENNRAGCVTGYFARIILAERIITHAQRLETCPGADGVTEIVRGSRAIKISGARNETADGLSHGLRRVEIAGQEIRRGEAAVIGRRSVFEVNRRGTIGGMDENVQ